MESAHLSPAAAERLREELAERTGPRRLMITDRIEKARELVRLLTTWQQHSRLYLVPFGDLQQQVVLSVPGPHRVIMYRRLMMRIAQAIAYRRHAQALVTGDVVGQDPEAGTPLRGGDEVVIQVAVL